jgi:hypothetical protein
MMDLIAMTMQQVHDAVPLWPQRFFNVVSCVVTWMLFLFMQHWRVHSTDFTFGGWWKADRPRIIGASVVTLALVILKATSHDIDMLLEFLGFKVTNSSGIAYGLAIAAILMGIKPKTKMVNNNNTSNGPANAQSNQKD